MPTATATLTEQHKADGIPRAFLLCAITLACRDAGVPVIGVRGDGSVVVFGGGRWGQTARVSPEDAAKLRFAAEAIDQGFPEMVTPFSFTLEWD